MLFVTAILVLPFGLIGYMAYVHFKTAENQAYTEIVAHADRLANRETGLAIEFTPLLAELGRASSVLSLDGEACTAEAKRLLVAGTKFGAVLAATPDGRIFCHSAGVPSPPLNISDRGWFKNAVAAKGFGDFEFVMGRVVKRPALTMAYAVGGQDDIRAVVAVTLDLLHTSAFLKRAGHEERQITTYLLDRDGTILASSNEQLIASRFTDPALTSALHAAAPGVVADDIAEMKNHFVLRPVATSGRTIHLAVGYRTDLLRKEAWNQIQIPLAAFVIIACLAYAIAWFGSGLAIVQPIGRLAAAAGRFGSGDTTARLGAPYARNELGVLANAFDRMADAAVQTLSELRQSEKQAKEQARRNESVLRASPVAIVGLDRDANVTSWNEAAERLYGVSAAEAIGKPHPGVAPGEWDSFLRHFETQKRGEGLHNQTAVRKSRDGRTVDVELSSAPMFDDYGEFTGVVYFVNDVTDRNKLQTQFLQSQKMEAVGQLTGGIAHDFNNLLGVVIGNLDLIRERVEGDAGLIILTDAALEAGLRGADLNRRLLAFSRRQTLKPEIVEVNAAVSGMVTMLRRTLGEHVEIKLECADDVWPVLVDSIQLETAVLNLAVNARDAMPNGGILTIETKNAVLDANYAARHTELSPGKYAMIAVSDTGSGMPPDVIAKAFEPFFTTKAVGKGTGLGLSMVHGFIKQSGGHVNIYSEIGRGTTIRLYLPQASGVAQADVPEQAQAVRGNELVLVVEDQEIVRTNVVRMLTSLGYRTIEADGAENALAELDAGLRPDLVFTDVVMPGKMNGIEFAEVVQSRWPGIRILLSSGFTERATVESRRRDKRTLEFPLLSKPYRMHELARAIHDVLQTSVNVEADR